MLTTWQTLINTQYQAALCTLSRCIDQCPQPDWDAPVADLKFCRVAFHVLFFTDYYLESTEDTIRDQDFHRANLDAFRDYEELEDRKQQLLYERPFLKDYVQHCRAKSGRVVTSETEQTLTTRCGFTRRDCSRAELHVLNIRHIQHHTAQLSLKLKLDTGRGVGWVGSGWPDEQPGRFRSEFERLAAMAPQPLLERLTQRSRVPHNSRVHIIGTLLRGFRHAVQMLVGPNENLTVADSRCCSERFAISRH